MTLTPEEKRVAKLCSPRNKRAFYCHMYDLLRKETCGHRDCRCSALMDDGVKEPEDASMSDTAIKLMEMAERAFRQRDSLVSTLQDIIKNSREKFAVERAVQGMRDARPSSSVTSQQGKSQ